MSSYIFNRRRAISSAFIHVLTVSGWLIALGLVIAMYSFSCDKLLERLLIG